MTRSWKILPLFVLALFSFGGCRPKDPLEWKISAGSPNDYEYWADENLDRLPADLRREFSEAMLFLRGDSGLAAHPRSMHETHNQLCLRIDGKTVRQVILDGYHVEKMFLLRQASLEADHIVRNLQTAESLEGQPEQLKRFATVKAQQEQIIEITKKRLAEIETRVAALSPPTRHAE